MTQPVVSFLIPTYNAGKIFSECLKAISDLNYPKNKIEILVADGGSSDGTVDAAEKYGAIVLDNPRRTAEYGKRIAFDYSSGDVIVLLDSDNVIASSDWLTSMLLPLSQRDVIGVESNYLIAKNFTSLNTYANLLIIVDPVARKLAPKPIATRAESGYIIKKFAIGSNPVGGANGFLWRRSAIKDLVKENDNLNEVRLLGQKAREGEVSIGNIPAVGIYHYYCEGLADYISKRKKIASKHLERATSEETWVKKGGRLRLVFAVLYSATIVGPTVEAVVNIIKSRNIHWLWHPLISILTVNIYAAAYIKEKML